ncbi:hypothetical protein AEA42_09695 [Shewanella sp. Sh95]|uniref:hypothetical protein n=1 Tax=Shewanella TaxID=22 RepID=UPI0006DB52AA|nr:MULTISPECIES: hypothetical protein [Shewanella]KPN77161.1 hypothetical protein AEA42_09695 [Shewanella sp. Sh95]
MNKKAGTAVAVGFVLLLSASSSFAAQQVTKSAGGTIKTELGYGIVLNKESSLTREWITIHDDSLPVDIVGTTGVSTSYQDRNYQYVAEYSIKTKEDISAIEIRFLIFDIWGNHVTNLSATDIEDTKAEVTKTTSSKWNEYSENRVSEYYASIAYISQVRTADGRVIKANPETVLIEARKFSEKFSKSDLEPKPEKEK